MSDNIHKCDECGAKIKRHVFCKRACNIRFFNKMRYQIEDTLSIAKEAPTHSPFDICPKHKVQYNSCLCK